MQLLRVVQSPAPCRFRSQAPNLSSFCQRDTAPLDGTAGTPPIQVLDGDSSTCASDVYSFGIVAWEVLSTELPWASLTRPRDIYIQVAPKNLRPNIPYGTPSDIAAISAVYSSKS